MHAILLRAGLCLSLGLAALSGVSPAQAAQPDVFFQDVVRVLEREIYDRYSGGDNRFPVFNTNYDWHSSVHAHWAIFRLARLHPEYLPNAARLKTRVSAVAVGKEFQLLKANRSFELPYGRSWFLKLVTEWTLLHREQGWPEAELLTDFGDEMAATLLAYVQALPLANAFDREYASPAWALAQLRDYYAFRGDAGLLSQAQNEIDRLFSRPVGNAPKYGHDLGREDFFSVFGNWAYVLTKGQNASQIEEFLIQNPVADAELGLHPDINYREIGQLWSRAWSFKALARKLPADQAQRFWDAYEQHVDYGIQLHEQYKDNWIYTHWVTQFATYALTD